MCALIFIGYFFWYIFFYLADTRHTRVHTKKMSKRSSASISAASADDDDDHFELQANVRNTRSRGWCFTWNNYTSEDIQYLKELDVVYMICGQEVAPTTGTPHLQGYIYFSNPRRFTAVKSLLRSSSIQSTNGSADANRMYCSKGAQPKKEWEELKDKGPNYGLDAVIHEIGTCPLSQQQKGECSKERYAEILRLADEGDIKSLKQEHPSEYLRHYKVLNEMAAKARSVVKPNYSLSDFVWPPISDWSKTHILWGPPGNGKTEFAKSHFADGCLFVCNMDDLKKFDPDLHHGIVFDDMSVHHHPREAQIHLVDQDNHRSIHNRFVDAELPAHTKKIFTTNRRPMEMMLVDDPAIARRIQCRECQGKGFLTVPPTVDLTAIEAVTEAPQPPNSWSSSSIWVPKPMPAGGFPRTLCQCPLNSTLHYACQSEPAMDHDMALSTDVVPDLRKVPLKAPKLVRGFSTVSQC